MGKGNSDESDLCVIIYKMYWLLKRMAQIFPNDDKGCFLFVYFCFIHIRPNMGLRENYTYQDDNEQHQLLVNTEMPLFYSI